MTVTYRIEVDYEEEAVRGNAVSSGDLEFDRQVEDEILARMAAGDVWAWAQVTMIAEYEGFRGSDVLGGCSYKDENDFKRDGGYYEDMKTSALADLKSTLKARIEQGWAAQHALDNLNRM